MFLLLPHALKNRIKPLEGQGQTQVRKWVINTDNKIESTDIGNDVERATKHIKGKTVLRLGFILFLLS